MSKKTKIEVKFFLSYAHENIKLASRFKKLILTQMRPSKKYDYHLWNDEDNIQLGEIWAEEIDNALETCNLGLLLVTPSFLGSKFITDVELPKFVGEKSKACIPVMLSRINMERHDTKGLYKTQFFRYKTPKGEFKSFSDCQNRHREWFCEDLFEKIEASLDKLKIG